MYLDEIKYFLAFFKKRKKIPDNFNEVNGFKTLNVALEVKKNIWKNYYLVFLLKIFVPISDFLTPNLTFPRTFW